MTANTIITRPPWLKKRLVMDGALTDTRRILSENGVHTVCESGICPNQNECFSNGHATFLLLGDICTRSCAFCSVKKGSPSPVDRDEPHRIADAVKKLGLRYVVLTSVTRDDLEDGGAGHFADVIREIRRYSAGMRVEVLTPDFMGDRRAIEIVTGARPEVFGHNIETVENLYAAARAGADYSRSLELLRYVKKIDSSQLTKSSIMLGLGEREAEVVIALEDLREAGCDIVTIGQYLSPRPGNLPVAGYVTPEEFERYKTAALGMGFKYVSSGPFVRSSYLAEEAYYSIIGGSHDRS